MIIFVNKSNQVCVIEYDGQYQFPWQIKYKDDGFCFDQVDLLTNTSNFESGALLKLANSWSSNVNMASIFPMQLSDLEKTRTENHLSWRDISQLMVTDIDFNHCQIFDNKDAMVESFKQANAGPSVIEMLKTYQGDELAQNFNLIYQDHPIYLLGDGRILQDLQERVPYE